MRGRGDFFFLEPLDFILRVHRHSLRDGLLRFSSRSLPELLSSPLFSVLEPSGESSPGLLGFLDLPSR